jgi:hypothetical protein
MIIGLRPRSQPFVSGLWHELPGTPKGRRLAGFIIRRFSDKELLNILRKEGVTPFLAQSLEPLLFPIFAETPTSSHFLATISFKKELPGDFDTLT